MRVSIDNQTAVITASGMEFLKLKTEIYKRVGEFSISDRNTIKVPVSALPLLKDLLEAEESTSAPVRTALAPFDAHAAARTRALSILESDDRGELPQEWVEILDPAQATAVHAMTLPNLLGLCLFDEQGSGKTVMTLAAFDILVRNDIVDAMIVVCPKSMIGEWPKDLERFLPGKYKTIRAEGDKRQKYDAALSDFQLLITNYEGVDAMLSTLMATADKRRYLLTVDESYYLKNSDSIRSVNVSKLRSRCARCFVLCGTPAPNSAHDLIHQFDLADLGYTFGGFSKSKDPAVDWDAISEAVDTKGLFIRRLKTEILKGVPEKNFHVIRIGLRGRQAAMYERARKDLALELRSLDDQRFKKSLLTYFQQRATLLQICCCPNAIDPTFVETPVKYEALDKLLAELTAADRKVIVWTYYRKSLDECMVRYASYNPVRVDGSVSTINRREAVEAFQTDPSVKLFVGNPAAAGAGITLHASYDAVYLSYTNQAAHYLQSLDRIHRRGQISDHVNYYLLVCEGTIEETEIVKLRGKEIKQHKLLGDQIAWPTSLDDALNELSPHE